MAVHFSEEEKAKLQADESELYRKRTKETNEEDVKNLTLKEKFNHFKYYYLGSTLVAIVVIIMAILVIRDSLTKKADIVLNVAIVDDAISEERLEAFRLEVEEYLGVDGDNERVEVDSSYSSSDSTLQQQLQTYLYSNVVDVVIAPKEVFTAWAQGGYFMDPDNFENAAFYEEFDQADRFYSVFISGEDIRSSDDLSQIVPSDEKEYNYGLSLGDSDKYTNLGFVTDAYIGISVATKNGENAEAFVKYMEDNEIEMDVPEKEE